MDLRELLGLLRGMESFSLRSANTTVLDKAIKRLKDHTPHEPTYGQLEATVQRFWSSGTLLDFNDQRLVSHGLLHPIDEAGTCLWQSRRHLTVLLQSLGTLKEAPRKLRRCYWGLLQAYFSIDAEDDDEDPVSYENWITLRRFLKENMTHLGDEHSAPEWVALLRVNKGLFEDHPCDPYAEALLSGDSSAVQELEATLTIGPSSWFRSQLLVAQVDHVVNASDKAFVDHLPLVLERIADNRVYRDRLFAYILDRYSVVPNTPLHKSLRDNAVAWWGNPWLPTNQPNWARVNEATKRMVTTWLNTEFITAFFKKLSNDGAGDTRRAKFWLKYAPVMSSVHFGLTPHTYGSRDRDMEVLKYKLHGLWTKFRSSGSNNAFIMFLGPLVLVEFGDAGAVYGYDTRTRIPFDIKRTLEEQKNILNSLKHDSRVLWKSHASPNWATELAMELRDRFDIVPYQASPLPISIAEGPGPRPGTLPRAGNAMPLIETTQNQSRNVEREVRTFTDQALRQLARQHELTVDDQRHRGGNLWVRMANISPAVESKLEEWGFEFKPRKGWWL